MKNNEYPQSIFCAKNIRVFSLKIFIFLGVKFSIYLNRRVFVMVLSDICAKRSDCANQNFHWVHFR